jgi:branched-chain amino acid transport system substrate-binding protein
MQLCLIRNIYLVYLRYNPERSKLVCPKEEDFMRISDCIRSKSGLMLLMAVMIFCLGANGQETNNNISSASGETVLTIGALLPLTGDLQSTGEVANASIEVARRDFEAMYPNVTLKLQIEDTASDPAIALNELKSMQNMGIRDVIGPMSSAEVDAVRAYAESNGIILNSLSTATSLAIDDTVFRFMMNDSYQAEALTAMIRDEKIKYVIPVFRADIYGEGFNRTFAREFEAQGGVVDEGIGYAPGIDPASVAASLKTKISNANAAYGADKVAVLLVSYDEAGQIMDKAADLNLPVVRWFGTDSTAMSNAISSNQTAIEFAIASNFTASIQDFNMHGGPYVPLNEFVEYLKEKVIDQLGREPDPTYQYDYDMFWLAGLTLMKAQASDLKETTYRIASKTCGFSGLLDFDAFGDREFCHYGFYRLVPSVNRGYRWDLVASYHFRRYWPTPKFDKMGNFQCTRPVNLTIGALLPMSGSYSSQGSADRLVLEKAREDVNKVFRREFDGLPEINVVYEDTRSDPETALAKMKFLHERGIDYFIGPYTSAELEAVKPYVDSTGVTVASISSTAPSLAVPDRIFRLSLNDTVQAKALAETIESRGIVRIVPIYRNDTYGRELHEALKHCFNGTVESGVSYSLNASDYSKALDMLEAEVEDAVALSGKERTAVMLISTDEADDILRNAHGKAISSVRWFGADGVANNPAISNDQWASSFAENVSLTASIAMVDFVEYDPIYCDVFTDDMEKVLGARPNIYSIDSYDALWLYAYSFINQRWNITGIADAFPKLSNNTIGFTTEIGFNKFGDRSYGDFGFYKLVREGGKDKWRLSGVYKLFTNRKPELVAFD